MLVKGSSAKLSPGSKVIWVIDSECCQESRARKSGQHRTGSSEGPPHAQFRARQSRQHQAGSSNVPPRTFRHESAGFSAREDALKTLGLPPNSHPTRTQVKKAFKAAALKWHPDKNKDNVDAAT